MDPATPETLPAIALDHLTGEELRQRFRRPVRWVPEFVGEPRFADVAAAGGVLPPLMPAAVLIPLIDRPDGLRLLLTLRSTELKSHSGQVAFPGGRIDPGDGSPVAAALREAREEVGLDAALVDVLGSLPQYETGTGFTITPVVALVDGALDLASLVLEPAEVAEVFEVPLHFLMDPANHQRRLFRWTEDEAERQRSFFAMPWRAEIDAGREYFIWGATAAMLRNFYRFLAAE